MMRWGLIPCSGSTSYPLINATVEKLNLVRLALSSGARAALRLRDERLLRVPHLPWWAQGASLRPPAGSANVLRGGRLGA